MQFRISVRSRGKLEGYRHKGLELRKLSAGRWLRCAGSRPGVEMEPGRGGLFGLGQLATGWLRSGDRDEGN